MSSLKQMSASLTLVRMEQLVWLVESYSGQYMEFTVVSCAERSNGLHMSVCGGLRGEKLHH